MIRLWRITKPPTSAVGWSTHNDKSVFTLPDFSHRVPKTEGIVYSFLGVGGGILLPTGSEERGVLGVGSIPVAIPTSYQDMKTVAS